MTKGRNTLTNKETGSMNDFELIEDYENEESEPFDLCQLIFLTIGSIVGACLVVVFLIVMIAFFG